MFSLFLVLLSVSYAEAGCYQRRMCCTGRNISCKAIDDGIGHIPTTMNPYRKVEDPHHFHATTTTGPFTTYQTPYYEASGDGYDLVYPDVYDSEHHQRIGKVVFPDVVELEGSSAGDIYLKYAPTDDAVISNRVPKSYGNMERSSPVRKITHFLFGYPQGPDTPPEDIQRYTPKPKHLLIRYSILSQHLPLTVSTTPITDYYDDEEEEEEDPTIMYLESPRTDCYCDESCVTLGDCCSDYTFVCPRRDCYVSSWGPWENCIADDGTCGIGVQQRTRYVRQEAIRGGKECPPLKEMRTCYVECPKRRSLDDITTVALLLDYRYNDTRSKTARDNIYWDLPSVHDKLKEATYYCVKYKIGYVNRNCWHKQYKTKLYRGNTICAECQPEATLHRNNGRCASDLEDGEHGFWKLIGPKTCNGMWTRIERTNDCHCSVNHPDLDPFLLV
ncbi:unnamed protein product [Cylicocyclus nassatus]|uniref:SMB domain-containing protein n=1 Tax=Cylicocyclus nassatus TaxID=53992 RepID=A0AA36M786_CYLNA|nr:unnamed protein product [Cylicocyclus nassatus]